MIIVDTHCHLDFKDFDHDRPEAINKAKSSGVEYIINVGSSVEGSKRSCALANEYEFIFATVGIHPHEAKDVKSEDYDTLEWLIKNNKKVVAIGEIGLDYYRNLSPKDKQIEIFIKQLELSNKYDLPIVIHSREAFGDTLEILKKYKSLPIKGVMHCFSGDEQSLKECLELGLYISFTSNVTYKKAQNLRDLSKLVPIEKMCLETDAPYLAPENLRGKRNEPANLISLIKLLAELKKLSESDIARITTHNANQLFSLGIKESENVYSYEIRDSLYLNITNQCTNNCDFCIRNTSKFVKGHSLWLDNEPSAEDVLSSIKNPGKYKEIVFCGYGEPTTRLDVLIEIAESLKKSGSKIRLVTNGQGDLINKKNIVKDLAGLIDRASVSLNADTKELYNKFCFPAFGDETYEAVKKFIRDCRDAGIEVEATCLDLPGVDVKRCESIAKDELKVNFRFRQLGVVG